MQDTPASEAERLHRHLVGQQGGRRSLNTPALVIDLDRLDRNIAAMAAFAASRGVGLRPHAKTHKSADVARRQIGAGALGICCAKLGEAEALAAEGIGVLLVTSPIVTPQAIARLVALNAAIPELMVVADHPANVAALAAAAAALGKPLAVLVDIDPGVHRTGVPTPDAAVALARDIAQRPSLRYAGVQFYCGTLQHIAAYADRRRAVETSTAYLRWIVDMLADAGLAPPIVTGAGTGTHHIDAQLGVMTELQAGSYVFMDRQYGACDLQGAGTPAFEQALQIDASVVSANTPGMATLDAGLKAMATEAGPPGILAGADRTATTSFMGDEHSAIVPPVGHPAPRLGERVVLLPPHCDPTVNLYDAYHVVQADTLVDIWPVTARGRSR